MANRLTKGEALFGAVAIGAGSKIKGIKTGTVAVDPASINAATRAATAVTITGAAVGDIVIFNPPSALEAGLVFAGGYVSAGDTAQVLLANITAAPVDGASHNWTYLWIDLT